MSELKVNNNHNIVEIDKLINNLSELVDKNDLLLQISSRTGDPTNTQLAQFNVFDDKKLNRIAKDMPEINRATKSFGRTNSQTSDKLMSLTMIAFSPYRYLHQCLAKIESRRQAIKETQYKLRHDRLDLEELQCQLEELQSRKLTETPPLDEKMLNINIARIKLKIEEKAVSINDAILYFEGALKEITVYQDAYNQIKTNNNIPSSWDEKDFEEHEIEHHIKGAFLNGFRDIISHGSLNMGTLEYFHQFGINPITAQALILNYIEDANDVIRKQNQFPNIQHLNNFLDGAFDAFKDMYKDQMKHIGLTRLITEDGLFLDNNK